MADEHVSFNDLLNSLPIDTSGSSVVPGRYITQVGVQWGSNDITLLFFEAKFPLAPFADSTQNRTFLESLNYIPAECVGRMILQCRKGRNPLGLAAQRS